MLFKDILDKKTKLLSPEFDKMFADCIRNQAHEGDLLLAKINGHYNDEIHKWSHLPKKISPYMIGPDKEGLSWWLHYEFIQDYRTQNIFPDTYGNYLKQFEWRPEKKLEREQLIKNEEKSIQFEMLIYLKIWESDTFIKRFYQLVRLSKGDEYDWHFKIKESSRSSGTSGTREHIIRKLIRDKIQGIYPNIYDAFKAAYKTQLRNSIAHSKYSFLSRHIHPNNFIENDPASQIQAISFDDWIELFHDTIVLYNECIRFFKNVGQLYSVAAQKNDSLFPIRVIKKYPSESSIVEQLRYRIEFKDWRWFRNEFE